MMTCYFWVTIFGWVMFTWGAFLINGGLGLMVVGGSLMWLFWSLAEEEQGEESNDRKIANANPNFSLGK